MNNLKPAILSQLEADNRAYCDYNQGPRSDCELMLEKGHPAGAAYQELRGFYDSLKYACNSSARRFTHKNKLNCSEYWAPTLDLSWYPEGELAKFGHIYPAHARWNEYIEAVAAAGWPAGTQAKLEGGSWLIRTQSLTLRDKFLALQAKNPGGRFSVKTQIDEESKQAYYAIDVSLYDVARALKLQKSIVGLLTRHQKAYVLPARSPAQTNSETQALPLAQKKFTLGNVDKVTVAPRHVMVPLISLPVNEALVLQHCQDLESLCDKGFPFALAKEWLSTVLAPASLKVLQEKYA